MAAESDSGRRRIGGRIRESRDSCRRADLLLPRVIASHPMITVPSFHDSPSSGGRFLRIARSSAICACRELARNESRRIHENRTKPWIRSAWDRERKQRCLCGDHELLLRIEHETAASLPLTSLDQLPTQIRAGEHAALRSAFARRAPRRRESHSIQGDGAAFSRAASRVTTRRRSGVNDDTHRLR